MTETTFQAYLQQCNRENVLSKAVFQNALENPEERLPLLKDLIVQLGYSVIEYDMALYNATLKEEEPDFYSLFKPLDEFEEEEANWLIPGWIPE